MNIVIRSQKITFWFLGQSFIIFFLRGVLYVSKAHIGHEMEQLDLGEYNPLGTVHLNTDRQKDRHIYRHTDGQTGRQTDRQTGRQTDG